VRTYKLHVLRHGLTDTNISGIFYGSTDIPLHPEGRAELSALLENYSYPYAEMVFSSPLIRATETARILYPDTEIIELDGLRELSFGTYEGKSMSELSGDEQFSGFIAGKNDSLPNGVESPLDFYSRSVDAFISIVNMMMTSGVFSAAVITHTGVIGNVLSGMAYPKAPPYEWNPSPGFGYTIVADPSLFLREPVFEVIDIIPKLIPEDELY